jgi:diguanylate cyclase (GGDEF)-like protein
VTELPNSRGLAESLQRQFTFGTRLALLTIRIDSLREVNETLGRAMGDELLKQAAGRLQPLAEDGWCAKTASDEFTIVARGGNAEAEDMAQRVVEAFEAPVLCDDVALAITAGIGVVLAPEHGRETEILLRRASLAASRSRVEGTRVTVWAADRDPYDPQRLAIAADLRDAIPAGELQVHFQPQVDIDTGLVTGAEALVRWRHPRLGELRPDQFIAAAEYTGAIDALTEHVVSVAAETCAGWRAQGWDLDVSVNLSARNLANLAFADTIRQVLDESELDPAALTLELTESSIMTEAAEALSTLEAINGLGVSLSIDDFGTGYSSLAHLRKLPLSEIKIDKSFVFDLTTNHHDEAIVRSMVSLGHHLGLTVVVEGVETVEVRRRLTEMGADRIQGYLLSRPMPAPAFEQWIADRPVRMVDLSTDEAEQPRPQRIEQAEDR